MSPIKYPMQQRTWFVRSTIHATVAHWTNIRAVLDNLHFDIHILLTSRTNLVTRNSLRSLLDLAARNSDHLADNAESMSARIIATFVQLIIARNTSRTNQRLA